MTERTAADPGMPFGGFGSDWLDFFDRLGDNNTREWFKSHKDEYETQIAGPLRGLAELLEPEFGPVKIYRPYRDVRFSADKRPIQEQASLSAGDERGYGYYLQLSAEGLMVAGGLYQPARARLETFRTLLDSEATAAEVWRQLATAAGDGLALFEDGMLKSAPRGFRRDHPQIDLLRYTRLALTRHYGPARWMAQASCFDRVRDDWLRIKVWIDWLADHDI